MRNSPRILLQDESLLLLDILSILFLFLSLFTPLPDHLVLILIAPNRTGSLSSRIINPGEPRGLNLPPAFLFCGVKSSLSP